MYALWLRLAAILSLQLTTASASPERQSALDGSQYAVISPVYDGSTGTISYIRLYNGGTSASTFNITVVNASNGITVGSAPIQVPAGASPQYPLTSSGGSQSIFSQAGTAPSSGATYALYIQNSSAYAGYSHVTFNNNTLLFENNSVCSTPLNQQLASLKSQVLTNVHTSALAGGAYPSTVSVHNYSNASTTITFTVADSATGKTLGQFNQTISANSTVQIPESQIEAQFPITSAQPHINLSATAAGGTAPPIEMSQSIHNSKLQGDINMVDICAVNAVAPTVVQVPATSTTPTAYCGTIQVSVFPYNTFTTYFTASVATNGRLRGTLHGNDNSDNYWVGGQFVGTVSGTNFVASTIPSGGSAVGTIQNGVMSGTAVSAAGSGAISGSTSACSN